MYIKEILYVGKEDFVHDSFREKERSSTLSSETSVVTLLVLSY